MYYIKTEKFEGPFALLLDLIEKEKLRVSDLSLAQVADQYLEHIRGNEGIDLANLAEFLSVASKLILIKSRALLPVLEFTEEEEEEIKDLARQLEEYKKFKEASQAIGRMLYSPRVSYCRESYVGVVSAFYPPENIKSAAILVSSKYPCRPAHTKKAANLFPDFSDHAYCLSYNQ